jgi:predicted RNase H-like HicB family nuclease
VSTQTTTKPRQITLTENPDGRWTAYDTATQTVTQGSTRDDALDNLDNALGEDTNSTETQPDEKAPAAPLKKLVGMLSEEEADRAEKRSQEWREEFNREIMGDEERV